MVTFDEAAEMLDDIAEEFPQAFYKNLNGGVYVLPDVKLDAASTANQPLYIMGEYIRRHDLGRFIYIYYGSFAKVFSHLPPEAFRRELKKVLAHEFTHHLESLAGERGLELEDEKQMERYMQRRNRLQRHFMS